MIIQLMEDDGILFGGKPKNVVVQIKFDDGRILRVPYLASKSIASLYKDMSVLNNSDKKIPPVSDLPFITDKPSTETVKQVQASNGIIEKEDIVRCIKVEDRGKGATVDIVVGGEYRVIKVTKQNGVVLSYDVIDDKADTARRIYVMPHEVEFLRKRKTPILKEVGSPESIFPCDLCTKSVACVKESDGKYHGICVDCGTQLIKELAST